MSEPVTVVALIWAAEGRSAELAEYEDKALALLPDHGATVVKRLLNVDQDEGPTEIHVLQFPSESAVDYYLDDDRRQELAADRDRLIDRTQLMRVQEMG